VKTGGGATSTRYWSDKARLDPTFKDPKGEAISEAKEELVRRHIEEIFNRKKLAVCDETMAEDFVEHAHATFAQSAPGRVKGPRATRDHLTVMSQPGVLRPPGSSAF
jgi:hypothetical protein